MAGLHPQPVTIGDQTYILYLVAATLTRGQMLFQTNDQPEQVLSVTGRIAGAKDTFDSSRHLSSQDPQFAAN